MPPRRNYIQKTTGKKVAGVTTQLGMLAKPWLNFWAYNQGLENYKRLSQQIAPILNMDVDVSENHRIEAALKALTEFEVSKLYDKRDSAGDAGTLAHEFIENYLNNRPEPKTDGLPQKVIDKAEGCYLSFLDWEKSHQMKLIASEVQLTSEKKPVGGTIDHVIKTALTAHLTTALEILDIKTAKDIYLEAKIQVAKYGDLWNEHHPDQPIKGFHILRLGPSGEFTHKFFPDLSAYLPIFNSCSDIWQTLKALGERL